MSSGTLEINWRQQGTADVSSFVSNQAIDLQQPSVPATFIQSQDERGQRCKLTVRLQNGVHKVEVSSNARSCELYTVTANGEETYCASMTGTSCGEDRYNICMKIPMSTGSLQQVPVCL